MLNRVVHITLLAVAACGLTAVPAAAQDVGPAEGALCGFASVTDPTIEHGGVQTGEINGGPLVATAPGATISLRCTIQVGASNAEHSGADAAVAQSVASIQVAAVPPTFVSYPAPSGQPVYMCTQATINGLPYYYDDLAGTWSTSSGARCSEAIGQELFPGLFEPVLDLVLHRIGRVLCSIAGLADPVDVPGVLEIGPDGSVRLLGDEEPLGHCPPYFTRIVVWIVDELLP